MKRDLKSRTRAEFTQWSQTYDRHWLNRYLFEPSHAAMLRQLEATGAGVALDIACGTGELAMRLARRGWRVVGLDLCLSMLQCARSKLNGTAHAIRLAVADSERLPFPAGTFDAVTCANAFHHFPNQQRAVREMRRVLRPGGRLLILDGWPDHWLGRVVYDVVVNCVEGGVRHRESQDMRRLFHRAGFTQTSQERTYSPLPFLLTGGMAPTGGRIAPGKQW